MTTAGVGEAGAVLLRWPGFDGIADVAVTTREGGVSEGGYRSLNLSLSVGDDPAAVLENRRRAAAAFGADPADFVFADQVHETRVGNPRHGQSRENPEHLLTLER